MIQASRKTNVLAEWRISVSPPEVRPGHPGTGSFFCLSWYHYNGTAQNNQMIPFSGGTPENAGGADFICIKWPGILAIYVFMSIITDNMNCPVIRNQLKR
jgi:hypothetical protein